MKGVHGMLSKAQSKRISPQPSLDKQPKLTALEKGLLRWSMAERGDKVLDAYVGSGLMLEYLQRNMECVVCGVSYDMDSVRLSRSRLLNADIVYASLEEIPWRENTFDSVYVKLTAVPISEQRLRECMRVLKPGGQLLIGFVTIPAPLRPMIGLVRPEAEEAAVSTATRMRTLDMMRRLSLTQVTMQRADLFTSVGIGWKVLTDEPQKTVR